MQKISFILVLEFLILTFFFSLANDLLMVFLHQLGHFVVAASLGQSSASLIVGRYFVEFPPYLWFAGRVDLAVPISGSGYTAYYLAPAFTTLIPVGIAFAVLRFVPSGAVNVPLRLFMRSYLAFWLVTTAYSLIPSSGGAEGLSDGAALLGTLGRSLALSSPLGVFMSSWFASALFYAGWWIISSYFSAGSVRLNLPRLTVLVLSLSAFALLYALGILLPAVWSWLTAPPVPTGVKTTTT